MKSSINRRPLCRAEAPWTCALEAGLGAALLGLPPLPSYATKPGLAGRWRVTLVDSFQRLAAKKSGL